MNLNFPLPFFQVQSDISLRKEKDFKDFDFLLIMVFYALRNNELSKNLLIKDAIKNFLNLDEKFLPFIEERLKRLITNESIKINKPNNFQEINLYEDFLGYYEINETIAKNIDNNVFKGFDANNRETTYFLYKNLVAINNWEIVRKNILQESDTENKFSLSDFDLNDIEKISPQLVNSIDSYVDINESGYKISNFSFLWQNSKIALIDVSINIVLKSNNIYPETNIDLELLENIYDFKKIDYLIPFISKNLSLNKLFNIENISFKKEHNLKFSFCVFNDEVKEIKNNYDLIKYLIADSNFNCVFFKDEIYFIDIQKNLLVDLNITESKKIQVQVDYLNLFEINKEDQIYIFDRLIKFLDWKKIIEKMKVIPLVFQKYCYLSGLTILEKINENEESEKIKNIINFLSLCSINSDKFDNLNLSQIFFDYDDFPKFLVDLFMWDAKFQKKYVDLFINFKINENLQRHLNEIYKFDYLKKDKYFNVSAEETRLKNLKDFIKYTQNYLDKNKNDIESKKIEEIYTNYEKLKKSFQWINWNQIVKDFDAKLNLFRTELFALKNNKMKNIALNIRTLLEKQVALYGNFRQKDVNTNFVENLKSLADQKIKISDDKEISKIAEKDVKYFLEARNKSNSCLHHSEESKDINILNIDEKIDELQTYYKNIQEIIKGWKF